MSKHMMLSRDVTEAATDLFFHMSESTLLRKAKKKCRVETWFCSVQTYTVHGLIISNNYLMII